MRLSHNVKGISKLILILLLLVSFIVGALLSYIWTMGFYAPSEYRLSSQGNITIENVEFYPENATFFNVTLLSPSYSPSTVMIGEIIVSTNDGLLHIATKTIPQLPYDLAPGTSQTLQAYWNWANYTGQIVDVIVLVSEGESGATSLKLTPFMNLEITSVNFDPAVSETNFTVTVQSMRSEAFMNITRITLDGENVAVSPLLPYTLGNASVTFTLAKAWSDLQGTNASVKVETLQGFSAYKIQSVPEVLKVSNIVFNVTDTSSFNLTVQNVAMPQTTLNITQIQVYIQGETVTIENATPSLPYILQPDSQIPLKCAWNWSSYQGQSAIATITVSTQQGFSRSAEATIP